MRKLVCCLLVSCLLLLPACDAGKKWCNTYDIATSYVFAVAIPALDILADAGYLGENKKAYDDAKQTLLIADGEIAILCEDINNGVPIDNVVLAKWVTSGVTAALAIMAIWKDYFNHEAVSGYALTDDYDDALAKLFKLGKKAAGFLRNQR